MDAWPPAAVGGGAVDTSDLVQDSLHHTFSRLPEFEPEHAGALRAYLRRAVVNGIRDEMRRAAFRLSAIAPDDPVRVTDEATAQFRQLVDDQAWGRYRQGLERLNARDLLVRRGLLGAAAAAPAVGLGWLVASRPERTVGAAVTDPLAQALFAAAGIMLLVVVLRGRLLRRLDAWVYPETADQRQSLATATSALAQASQVRTNARRVARTVNQGCGSRATLLVAADTETGTGDYGAPDGKMAPLARGSAIVHMLSRGGGSVRVHPDDPASAFELLPRDDAAWVVETGADVVAAVLGPGAQVIGVVVVGRRFDDRIMRPVDVPFPRSVGGGGRARACALALAEGGP